MHNLLFTSHLFDKQIAFSCMDGAVWYKNNLNAFIFFIPKMLQIKLKYNLNAVAKFLTKYISVCNKLFSTTEESTIPPIYVWEIWLNYSIQKPTEAQKQVIYNQIFWTFQDKYSLRCGNWKRAIGHFEKDTKSDVDPKIQIQYQFVHLGIRKLRLNIS